MVCINHGIKHTKNVKPILTLQTVFIQFWRFKRSVSNSNQPKYAFIKRVNWNVLNSLFLLYSLEWHNTSRFDILCIQTCHTSYKATNQLLLISDVSCSYFNYELFCTEWFRLDTFDRKRIFLGELEEN